MVILRERKVLPVLGKRSPPFPQTPSPFTGLNFPHKILTSFCPPILSALITHLPHQLPKFSSVVETLQVGLSAFLITGGLTGWGGEMCIFSCGEEKKRSKENMLFPPKLLPLSSAGSWGLELEKFWGWKQDKATGGVEGGLTRLLECLFRRSLQNCEMCLLLHVGELTRNRYTDSVTLTAFDTCDSPLVRANSSHAEMDYCMRLLSWEPPFSNILILELAHLSTYWFIWRHWCGGASGRKDPLRMRVWEWGRIRLVAES